MARRLKTGEIELSAKQVLVLETLYKAPEHSFPSQSALARSAITRARGAFSFWDIIKCLQRWRYPDLATSFPSSGNAVGWKIEPLGCAVVEGKESTIIRGEGPYKPKVRRLPKRK